MDSAIGNYPANLMAFVQNRAEFSSRIQQYSFALDDVVREDAVNQVVLPAGTAVYPPGQEGDGSAPPFPILSAPLAVPLLHTVSLENQGAILSGEGPLRETRGAGSLQSQMFCGRIRICCIGRILGICRKLLFRAGR